MNLAGAVTAGIVVAKDRGRWVPLWYVQELPTATLVLRSLSYIHTNMHTYTHIYIYICVYIERDTYIHMNLACVVAAGVVVAENRGSWVPCPCDSGAQTTLYIYIYIYIEVNPTQVLRSLSIYVYV